MINDKAKSAVDTMTANAKKVMKNPQREMEKSSEDWIDYIKAHPLQSVLFGISIFYALKGMLKS